MCLICAPAMDRYAQDHACIWIPVINATQPIVHKDNPNKNASPKKARESALGGTAILNECRRVVLVSETVEHDAGQMSVGHSRRPAKIHESDVIAQSPSPIPEIDILPPKNEISLFEHVEPRV